jgi:hypothetical protein
MREKFTRRRFLSVVGAGATCLALTNAVGCDRSERDPRANIPRTKTPKGGAPSTPKVSHLPTASPAPREGAWAFRSRPDLSPPVVEVTTRAHDTASGYIFVAPEEGDASQGGSLMVDERGQVVWFRPLPGKYGRVHDLKVQSYRGKSVLTWVAGRNDYVIVDHTYREVARFGAGNGYYGDHHEFLISPQDTALILIYNPVAWDLSSIGGLKDDRVWQGIVQELDIETGKVLFEWHSLDHVGIEESYGKPGEEAAYPGLDYFHINSIDVDHDGNLLVSARKTFAVYKVDRKTGEVIWRLGGKMSDFEMGPGARFTFQHDARRLPDGTISIFDNGMTVFRNGSPRAVEESRGIVVELDDRKMKASLLCQYTHPDGLRADAAGNVQVLPNGNVFVGWGRALYFSEFGKDGELLFDARLPQNRSYRAFRFPWSAQPSDRPAAAAERTSEEEVRVHASWNGATDVATWEVLTGSGPGQLESLGSVPRDGFETAMVARTAEPYVAVRAKHRSGRILGTTAPVKV